MKDVAGVGAAERNADAGDTCKGGIVGLGYGAARIYVAVEVAEFE